MIGWLSRRLRGDDTGSVILALLGIVIMTGVATVGLATIVSGEVSARHDKSFEQALTGAESGLDAMIAEVRANPDAASFADVTGTDATTGVSYKAMAASTGSTGHWIVTSNGSAIAPNGSVINRTVQENVDSAGIFDVPLFGASALTMGNGSSALGSAVDTYDSAVNSSVCDSSGNASSMTVPDSRMCASTGNGVAATDGSLTMNNSDLSNFSQVDIDDAPVSGYSDPDATGKCVGDAATCASIGSKVIEQPDPLSFPQQSMCPTGVGVDAGADVPLGGFLHAGVNILPSGYTFNANVVANLNNLQASQVIVCFSGTLNFNVVGSDSLLPINSVPTVDTSASSLTNSLQSILTSSGNQTLVTYAPRPPSTLVFVDTSTSPGTSTINFGSGLGGTINSLLGLGNETSMSAVFYAPNASCTAATHVDIYGALICGSVSAPKGIDVHYDTELEATTLQQNVAVSHWRECVPASSCPVT